MYNAKVPPHYLRGNAKVWTPPTIISIDTETRTITVGDQEVLVLRCWHARLATRVCDGLWQASVDIAEGTTRDGLAAVVDAWTRNRQTVWLYAHNLGFDLTVTRLPVELAGLGWQVSDAAVDGRAPWVRMTKGRKRIALADSWSILPTALDEISRSVGIAKPALPGEDDYLESWLVRCSADTAILERAILDMLEYWESHKLGQWSITGGSSGWHAFRHIKSPWRITIIPDNDGASFGKQAVYGGMRAIWRAGDLPPGQYDEIDFYKAYTVIAAELPLPRRRAYKFSSLSLDDPNIECDRWGIVAEVTINTDVPRWPCRADGRVWYPVGKFRTVLAGPDIAEARRLGCLVSIGPGYMHQLGYAMQKWARWCLDLQSDQSGEVPGVMKIAAKHWGRSVIGKTAARTYSRVKLGPSPGQGWGHEAGWDHFNGVRGSLVDMAGQRWWSYADGYSDNYYPEILAWVEAYVRVRLARVIDVIGPGVVAQCDTDGLITASVAPQRYSSINEVSAPLVMRIKQTYHSIRVAGPQHYIADGNTHFSGVPSSARPGSDGIYRAKVWPKLSWQMAHGVDNGYVRPVQSFRIKGPYCAGWVASDMTVYPVQIEAGSDGCQHVMPWRESRWHDLGVELNNTQNPDLAGKW